MFLRNRFKSTWNTMAYFDFSRSGLTNWLLKFPIFWQNKSFYRKMRRWEPSFFYFSGDLKFWQHPAEKQWLEGVGRLTQCRTEVGVVIISGKYSIQISPLIYKNVTVYNKCVFRSKQSVYLQGRGEIHVYIIFFLLF